jgi:stage V sporulation protein B
VTDPNTRAANSTEQNGRRSEVGRNAGRGLIWISAAKLYFILSGYAVQLLLPRLLGSPESFGLFALSLSLVSIINNVLIASTVQTVSKQVSQSPEHAAVRLRQGLLLQLSIGCLLGGLLYALAPTLAGRVLLDPMLAPLLQVSALLVFSYALYATLVGALNGLQRFGRQAILDISYTTLRMAGVLGLSALGFGALGATIGLASAGAAVLVLALMLVGIGRRGTFQPWKSWVSFMGPLWLYQLCLSLALQVDLSVLKGSVAAMGMEAGMSSMVAAETASRMAGFYRAAQTFAFVPYQLILSVTFVIFPMISSAQSSGDQEASKRYVENALRFSLFVLLAIAAPVSGAASGVMRVAYPDAYLAGSGALAILAPGTVCFALFVIGATMLSSAGRPQIPALIAIGTVIITMGCNVLFVRIAGIGNYTLQALAAGTALGMTFALVAMSIAVAKHFATFIPWSTTARMLLAAAAAWLVAHALPSHSALLAIGALTFGGLTFVVVLLLSGEIRASDLRRVRTLGRRG